MKIKKLKEISETRYQLILNIIIRSNAVDTNSNSLLLYSCEMNDKDIHTLNLDDYKNSIEVVYYTATSSFRKIRQRLFGIRVLILVLDRKIISEILSTFNSQINFDLLYVPNKVATSLMQQIERGYSINPDTVPLRTTNSFCFYVETAEFYVENGERIWLYSLVWSKDIKRELRTIFESKLEERIE